MPNSLKYRCSWYIQHRSCVHPSLQFKAYAEGAHLWYFSSRYPLGKLAFLGSPKSYLWAQKVLAADTDQQFTYISMVQHSCMTTPNSTWHSKPSICCRSLVRKRQNVPHKVQIWQPPIFLCFASWSSICQGIISTVTQMSNVIPSCGWHNCNICSGQTYHTLLWQTPQPSTRLGQKIAHQWHTHWDCQFPLLISCDDLLTANILSDPPSYLAINLQAQQPRSGRLLQNVLKR